MGIPLVIYAIYTKIMIIMNESCSCQSQKIYFIIPTRKFARAKIIFSSETYDIMRSQLLS